jgi:hypothetical protein
MKEHIEPLKKRKKCINTIKYCSNNQAATHCCLNHIAIGEAMSQATHRVNRNLFLSTTNNVAVSWKIGTFIWANEHPLNHLGPLSFGSQSLELPPS